MLFDGLVSILMQNYGAGAVCQTVKMMVFDVIESAGS
jgi:hypothetical protein